MAPRGRRGPELAAGRAVDRRRQDRIGGEPWGMAQFCFLSQCSTPSGGGTIFGLVLFWIGGKPVPTGSNSGMPPPGASKSGRGEHLAGNSERSSVIDVEDSPERAAKPDGYMYDDKRELPAVVNELVYVNLSAEAALAAGAVTSTLSCLARYAARFGPACRRRVAAHRVLPCAGWGSRTPTIWIRTFIRRTGSSRCSHPSI